ncbi:hypothetical protein MCHI_000538 [Candidatus Magnetoovum chiemensis]|nr:hypothetical protein MCHI_000538 [Candidatus Magnetoovum chiemensis]
MRKRIVSLVGLRALPVISPIYTHLKTTDNIEALLIHTKDTESIANTCSKALIDDLHLTNALHLLFPAKLADLRNLVVKEDIDEYIFILNGGMNWQIALLYYMIGIDTALSKNSELITSDANYLSKWRFGEDISNAKKKELKNLGLELYKKLNKDIEITVKNEINNHLSEPVKKEVEKLKLKKSYLIQNVKIIKDVKTPSHILDLINNMLVSIRERKGFLHLLFDLDSTVNTTTPKKELFRLVTSIFDPLNYFVTVMSTDSLIKERATTEGIPCISNDEIKNWLKTDEDVKPKNISAGGDVRIRISQQTKKYDETIFLCIGNNVEPTLKAIYSFMEKDDNKNSRVAIIFYDKYTKIIASIAENMKKTLMLKRYNSNLIETDHLGSGIIDYVCNYNGGKVFFNCTPGTKDQTIALVSAAIRINRTENIYTLDKAINKNLLSNDTFNTISASIDDISACLLPSKKTSNTVSDCGLWENVLNGLSQSNLIPHADFNEIKNSKKRIAFEINGTSVTYNNKLYTVTNVEHINKSGLWWEQTVAYAIKENLNVEPKVNLQWKSEGGGPYTELDVVFNYKEHICVISCKTYKKPKDLDAFLVRSETDKRIGRFAISFIAVPFEDYADKEINDVKILSPEILNDKTKLEEIISKFMSSKRTSNKPEAN